MKDRKKPEKFLLPHGMPSDGCEFAFSSRVPSKALTIKIPYTSRNYQCKTLQNTPCGNDVRYHLEKYKDMQGLELQLNRAFQDRLPPRLVNSQQCVATDFNL